MNLTQTKHLWHITKTKVVQHNMTVFHSYDFMGNSLKAINLTNILLTVYGVLLCSITAFKMLFAPLLS